MSTQTLSSVAIDVVEQYKTAGKHLTRAIGALALPLALPFALPFARVSLQVANALAEGTRRLSERVAGVEEPLVDAPEKKRVQRRTRRA